MLKSMINFRIRWLCWYLPIFLFSCDGDSAGKTTVATEPDAIVNTTTDTVQHTDGIGTADAGPTGTSQDSAVATATTLSTTDSAIALDASVHADTGVPRVDSEDAAVPVVDAAETDVALPIEDTGNADAASTITVECPPSENALVAGDSTIYILHDGRNRSYTLHVPPGVTGTTALPVVVDIHGAYNNGALQALFSGWNGLSDREGFLVVYPEGVEGSWNVDEVCCLTAGREKIDDVGFIKAVIEDLSERICIDRRRVYASGLSNGAGMTHRLGCEAADTFAAIAPVSTDLRTDPCNPTRPISVMVFRGLADSLEPYEGGTVGPPGGEYVAVGAKNTLELWRNINECTGTPIIIDEYCESYTECADGVETDLCSLPDTDHIAYTNPMGYSLIETAWNMFLRQPMK